MKILYQKTDTYLNVGPAGVSSSIIPMDGVLTVSSQFLVTNLSNQPFSTSSANIRIPPVGNYYIATHLFYTGQRLRVTTSGTLAAPLALATDYYAIFITGTAFALASSQANALAGIPILFTTSGTGNTTFTPGYSTQTFLAAAVDTTNDTITIANHGYANLVSLRITPSGVIPAPFVAATSYFVILVDANTFRLATTLANATAGTYIDITTQGTGSNNALLGNSTAYTVNLFSTNDGIINCLASTGSITNTPINGTSQMIEKVRPTLQYAKYTVVVTDGVSNITVTTTAKGY